MQSSAAQPALHLACPRLNTQRSRNGGRICQVSILRACLLVGGDVEESPGAVYLETVFESENNGTRPMSRREDICSAMLFRFRSANG